MIVFVLVVLALADHSHAGDKLPPSSSPVRPRGGASSPYELNPNYRAKTTAPKGKQFLGGTSRGTAPSRPLTLGDIESSDIRRPQPDAVVIYTEEREHQSYPTATAPPPPVTEIVGNFFSNLQKLSPTLHHGTVVSIMLFVLWQFPALRSSVLQQHFVCSRSNVLRSGRLHAAFLSAVSHSSLTHLVLNLYGFVAFGTSVRRVLQASNLPLWPFAMGSTASSSAVFLALSPPGGSGCIGLSGVTLALLAFDAMVYPSKELGFIVGFVPIRMPARHAVAGLFVMSAFGMAAGATPGRRRSGNVAHACHLGGLAFGVAYYEALSRGYLTGRKGPKVLKWLASGGRKPMRR